MPVTVMVYEPVGVFVVVEMISWLVNEGIPFAGLTPAVSPVAEGEIDAARFTG